jgi:hypothetical protein
MPVVYRDGSYQHGYGVGHFGPEVENVDESVGYVRQRGAKILAVPKEFPGAISAAAASRRIRRLGSIS